MAKYTTELRSICETYSGLKESKGYNDVNQIIEESRQKVFDFDFPIYDESYRSVLETKIIKHFYTREICAETVGRWKLFLNERMNLIMPYFNQRYKSTLIEFNPMYDVDLTTDHNKRGSGNENNTNNIDKKRNESYNNDTKTNVNTNNDEWSMYSDTPQGGLNGIETNTYLTNATHNTEKEATTTNYNEKSNTSESQNENSESETNFTNTEDYLQHIIGKSSGVSFSKMLMEYRQTFLNIDNEIIENLNDLFFNLW